MEIIDALILGIIQGLTEYLPVSSSGHLIIFREILGIDLPTEQGLMFDVLLHAATVCSTIVILWPLFRRLCVSFFTFRKDADFWYVCKLLVSCIPVAIVGFCFKETVEEIIGSGLTVVGICLLMTALLLTFAHFSDHLRGRLLPAGAGRDITWWDALTIGVAQAVAVLPGLSRSGTTIATGIVIGDKRDKVASFSFLMVIIPILGEALLDMKHYLWPSAEDLAEAAATGAQQEIGALALAIGFLASFTVGCLACKWMLGLVRKGKLIYFAYYCLAVAILCLCWPK